VTASPFGYGGEQRDDETGLVNLRSRYYDPALGRFLSRDSLPGVTTLPQSWSRYSYVENGPINHTDPSGHKKKIKWPNGQDPDDDRARKKAKACRNPGSCKGEPPNPAHAAEDEAQLRLHHLARAVHAGARAIRVTARRA
jgi:RHS repeat-associated protein